MTIDCVNQVFAPGTIYVPTARGFVCLAATVELAGRKILVHRAAISLDAVDIVER
ncbi:hypothetical protein AAGS40_29775 (plasmid) [Paraburkholderia sp. PREW-6R]|uniref:hypothetical protein n=1 Tax=Paraburkholderia sp. PREW-6R TaxID=3141544 RepID=UPI0031F50395